MRNSRHKENRRLKREERKKDMLLLDKVIKEEVNLIRGGCDGDEEESSINATSAGQKRSSINATLAGRKRSHSGTDDEASSHSSGSLLLQVTPFKRGNDSVSYDDEDDKLSVIGR